MRHNDTAEHAIEKLCQLFKDEIASQRSSQLLPSSSESRCHQANQKMHFCNDNNGNSQHERGESPLVIQKSELKLEQCIINKDYWIVRNENSMTIWNSICNCFLTLLWRRNFLALNFPHPWRCKINLAPCRAFSSPLLTVTTESEIQNALEIDDAVWNGKCVCVILCWYWAWALIVRFEVCRYICSCCMQKVKVFHFAISSISPPQTFQLLNFTCFLPAPANVKHNKQMHERL